jgi:hypothetical protein
MFSPMVRKREQLDRQYKIMPYGNITIVANSCTGRWISVKNVGGLGGMGEPPVFIASLLSAGSGGLMFAHKKRRPMHHIGRLLDCGVRAATEFVARQAS